MDRISSWAACDCGKAQVEIQFQEETVMQDSAMHVLSGSVDTSVHVKSLLHACHWLAEYTCSCTSDPCTDYHYDRQDQG